MCGNVQQCSKWHNGAVSRADPGNEGPSESDGARLLLALVRELHATPQRTVMAFAGAGAEALALLHAVGGSSRTVLEATDVYADRSMEDRVGFIPAHFTSKRAAHAMAETAWRRARHLTTGERIAITHPPANAEGGSVRVPVPVFGLACTASIATDRAKKGEHRVVVAVRDGFGTVSYAITFEKGARDRAGEERVVSQLVLRAAADACGVLRPTPLDLLEGEELNVALEPAPLLAQFDAGERPYVVVGEDGTLTSELPGASWEGDPRDGAPRDGAQQVALLSGAFNPVHEGHLELARVAAGRVDGGHGRPVFEIPLVNADKSPIDVFEGRRRAQQFAGRAPLVLTREPLFTGKARLFPGCTFVVGADTAERIVDARFYGGDPSGVAAALEAVRAQGSRFLVAGRRVGGRMLTLEDVAVPAGFEALFAGIPEAAFRSDLASTSLRRGWR